MDTYSFLREFADSWVLLAMTTFYIAAILWAFRPGSKEVHRDIANIPLRNDTSPGDYDGGSTSGDTPSDKAELV